jgi:hypothetical protein
MTKKLSRVEQTPILPYHFECSSERADLQGFFAIRTGVAKALANSRRQFDTQNHTKSTLTHADGGRQLNALR